MSKTSLVCGMICGNLALVMLLAACGTESTSNPGTRTNGPVSITTNHARYTKTEPIQIGVTNHQQTAIYAFDTRAGCTILDLEVSVNGQWEPSYAARCALGRRAMMVKIAPGQTYTATINPGASNIRGEGLPQGTYRLVLSYSASASVAPPWTKAYSAPFGVSG